MPSVLCPHTCILMSACSHLRLPDEELGLHFYQVIDSSSAPYKIKRKAVVRRKTSDGTVHDTRAPWTDNAPGDATGAHSFSYSFSWRLFSLKTHVGTASARQPSRATPPLREIYPYTRGRLYQPSASLPQNSVHLGYICLPNGLSSTNL